MKKTNNYATNNAGVIKSPKRPSADAPKSTVKKGNDLRSTK